MKINSSDCLCFNLIPAADFFLLLAAAFSNSLAADSPCPKSLAARILLLFLLLPLDPIYNASIVAFFKSLPGEN